MEETCYEKAGDIATADDDGMGRGAPKAGRLRKERSKPRLLENWRYHIRGEMRCVKDADLRDLLNSMGASEIESLPEQGGQVEVSGSRRRKSSSSRSTASFMSDCAAKLLVICESHPDEHGVEFTAACRRLQARPVRPAWVWDTISFHALQSQTDERYGFSQWGLAWPASAGQHAA